jgi:hypothetical protein
VMRMIGPAVIANVSISLVYIGGLESHTILFVQVLDMECELPLQNHIVVEFIPIAQCGKLGSRISGEGAQIESIHAQPHEVYKE